MKKITALLLIFALMAALSSCKKAPEEINGYTFTDQAGRTVTLSETPERIVSGYYISTSALIALGLEDRIVGVEAKAGTRNLYRLCAPDIVSLPSVGTAKQFDVESCAAVKPDLVILPLKLESAVEPLEKLGIKVMLVDPETRGKVTEMIKLIGDAAGVSKRAEELNDFISDIEKKLPKAGENAPTVYMAGNSSPLLTAGNKMYQSDLIAIAGGVNAALDTDDTYWSQIGYEQLIKWDPDYIVIASDAQYDISDIMDDRNLSGLSAVKNGRVYKMPDSAEAWDSPVPGGILGAVWLAEILHPDVISEEYRDGVIDEFYERFYGFEYEKQ